VDTGQGAQPVVAMSELPTPLVVSRRVDVVTRKTSHPRLEPDKTFAFITSFLESQ